MRNYRNWLLKTHDWTRALAWKIERRQPRIARKILEVASAASTPLGSRVGLELIDVSDLRCLVQISRAWPDLGEKKASAAALVNAVESAVMFFWERHLLDPGQHLKLREISLKVLAELDYPLRVLYMLSPETREDLLYQMRVAGGSVCDSVVNVFAANEQLVATVEIKVELTSQLLLHGEANLKGKQENAN